MQAVITATVALLAITNPIGAVPIFLEITGHDDGRARVRNAVRACVVVVTILAVSVVAGRAVLSFFGISVDALRAAGGLIIVLMGIEMLGGSATRLQGHRGGPATGQDGSLDSEAEQDSLIVPFAMPLVAGPGAIATAITLATRTSTPSEIVELLVAVAIVGVVLFVALASSSLLERHISRRAHAIIVRFLGLLLTSIGVQYVLEGAQAVLRQSAG